MQLATAQSLKQPQAATMLRDLLRQFNRMYAPHEAREDTVLFPALRRLVSKEEYAALGEDFEKKEHELFGGEGLRRWWIASPQLRRRWGSTISRSSLRKCESVADRS
jgi:hemerythrin-like domain-containing protein